MSLGEPTSHGRASDSPLPPSPVTPLGAAFIALFEEFQGLVAAGFTESQALRLIAYQLAAAGESGGPSTEAKP